MLWRPRCPASGTVRFENVDELRGTGRTFTFVTVAERLDAL
jgi:hypothetical protein